MTPNTPAVPIPFVNSPSVSLRRVALLAVSAISILYSTAHAATATWSGGTSSTWQDNANWSAAYPGTSGTTDVATFNSAGNGNTSITAGTLALGGITFDTANAASYNIGSGTLSFTNPAAPTAVGVVNVTSTVINNQTISANIVAGNAAALTYPTGFTLSNTSQVAALNVSGAITGPASTNHALLNVRGTGAVNISGVISDGTTKLAVNSNRVGTTTLSGANTFSGVANNIALAGFDYNLGVGMGGRLVLDYSGGNVVVPSTTIIALGSAGNSGGNTLGSNTGGTLVFKTGSTAVTVGNLVVGNSYLNIVVDSNGGAGAVVTLGNSWNNWSGSSRATVNFDLSAAGASGGAKLSGAAAGNLGKSGNILTSGAKAVTMQDSSGETYFATTDGSNNIVAQTTYTTLPTAVNSSATNYQVTSNTTATGNITGNVLRIEGASPSQTLNLGGFTLSLTSAAFFLDGANDFTISNGLLTTSQNALNIGAFGTGKLTISASITAAAKEIYRSGNGLVEFTGNNSTATGGTRAQSGVTRFSAASAITGGNLGITNGGIVELGFDFTRALGTGAGQVSFSSGAPGGFSAYGADRFVNIGGAGATLTYATTTVNNFVASRDSQLVLSSSTSDSTIDFQNGLNFASDTQTIKVNNGSASVDAKLSGKLTAGGLVKSGAGTLSITNNTNDYAGGTVVSAGTLLANNTTGSATGTGAVYVASGATLGGSGFISGATTIANGGTLAPGNSPGVLSFTSNLTLGGSTLLEIAGTTRGTSYDGINVTGALTYGGTLAINFSSTVSAGNTFDLFAGADGSSAPGGSGSFTGVSIAGEYVASLTNNSGVWTGSAGGFDFVFTQATGDLVVATSSVPEPSTYAAILGVLVLAGSVLKRRRVIC